MFAPSQPLAHPAPPHLVVQILSTITFGIFAIVATAMAFDAFWPAGLAVALAIVIFGFGRRSDRSFGRKAQGCTTDSAPTEAPRAEPQSTGNATFDAYRADVLKRLEDEQASFVAFLDRLRAARDKSELDTFMADRARTNADADTPRGVY